LKNQKNKNMAANIDHGVILGALGSAHTDGTGAITPPTGMVIAAIQFISKNTPQTLVAENVAKTFNTDAPSHNSSNGSVYTHNTQDHGGGGVTLSGCEFPAGMTIYGRWTSASFLADSTGGVICYFGY